ncbi:MAG TPA: polyketide synthase dehydratase domain-containing protein, partial [Polyangiaceae bacterium]|nr:polyketide synthase dehydratase domain-containing protein [Polyangiaceae bacterium]
ELLQLHAALIEHQFTFRSFIGEWQTALTPRAVEVSTLLAKLQSAPTPASERLLGAVVLASSLERLYRKWGFSKRLALAPALERLVGLHLEQRLSRDDLVALLLGASEERAARLLAAQARCQQAPAEAWPADSDWPAPGAPAAQWLRSLQQQAPSELPAATATRLSVVRSARASEATTIFWDLSAEPSRELTRVALELWKRGHGVDLKRVIAPRHGRCALPLYPFAGERHWLPLEAAAAVASVAEPVRTPGPRSFEIDVATRPVTGEHLIHQRVVVPGALLLGLALGLGEAPRSGVSRLLFRAPAFAEPRCTLNVSVDARRIEVTSDATVVASAERREPAPGAWPVPRALSAAAAVEHTWLYDVLKSMGYGYGPRLQVVSQLRCAENVASARLDAAGSGAGTLDTFTRIVDGAFHVALAIWCVAHGADTGGLFVPQAIDEVELLGPLPEHCLVEAELQKQARDVDLRFEIRVRDLGGRPVLRLGGVHLRRVSGALAARPERPAALRYAPDWHLAAPLGAGSPPKQLILAAPDGPEPRRLAEQLAARGLEVTFAPLTSDIDATAPTVARAVDTALARVAGDLGAAAAPTLALLWLGPDWQRATEPQDNLELARNLSSNSFGLLEVFKLALGSKLRSKLRVLVLTRDAVSAAAGDSVLAYHEAGTVGLARSAMAESSQLDARSLDIDAGADWFEPLFAVLTATQPNAYAWRGARLYRPVLRELPPANRSAWLPHADGAYLIVGGAGGVGRRLLR